MAASDATLAIWKWMQSESVLKIAFLTSLDESIQDLQDPSADERAVISVIYLLGGRVAGSYDPAFVCM